MVLSIPKYRIYATLQAISEEYNLVDHVRMFHYSQKKIQFVFGVRSDVLSCDVR